MNKQQLLKQLSAAMEIAANDESLVKLTFTEAREIHKLLSADKVGQACTEKLAGEMAG